ncbi:hypothetical protein [Nostoc sp. C110]|uniref:hypothetical protein n=1 Tax=Nostoc sp. C110 TaxID=3349876 RepID=UPI00370DA046
MAVPPVQLLLRGYGVHTSLKIPPSTWFRHLAIGLCDGVPARRRRSLWKPVRSVRAASRREEERRRNRFKQGIM